MSGVLAVLREWMKEVKMFTKDEIQLIFLHQFSLFNCLISSFVGTLYIYTYKNLGIVRMKFVSKLTQSFLAFLMSG